MVSKASILPAPTVGTKLAFRTLVQVPATIRVVPHFCVGIFHKMAKCSRWNGPSCDNAIMTSRGKTGLVDAAGLRRVPTQARSLALVTALVDAAQELLVEQGLTAVTTKRVAQRAGVSIGSLYQYFADREGLVQAVAQRYAGRLDAALDRALSEEQVPLRQTVRRFFQGLVAAESEVPELGPRLLRLRAAGTDFPMFDAFEARLEAAIVDGIRARVPDDPLRREASVLSGRVVVQAASGTMRAMLRAGSLLAHGATVAEDLSAMAMAVLERWSRGRGPRAVCD